jgi:hypothetical protein
VNELLSEGKILSSSNVLPPPDMPLGMVMAPKDTRLHEIFIFYRGEVYLCSLAGSTSAGTPPYASCYGVWPDP